MEMDEININNLKLVIPGEEIAREKKGFMGYIFT